MCLLLGLYQNIVAPLFACPSRTLSGHAVPAFGLVSFFLLMFFFTPNTTLCRVQEKQLRIDVCRMYYIVPIMRMYRVSAKKGSSATNVST